MKGSVFISYRREGGDLFASSLYDRLKKKNFDVYLDIHNSRQGEWLERILNEVRTRDYIAVVLTSNIFKDWNSEAWKREDDIVFQELDEAVKANKKFVPIMLKGFVIPDPMSFPDDGRRKIINTIKRNEIFDFSNMRNEKKNWRDLLKFFCEDTVHPLFVVFGVFALALVVGGVLLLNLLREAKDPPSDPETQGQTVLETDPDTTEHQDADIITDESVINTEECTESDTFESTGNNGETTAESTEHDSEKETVEPDKYRIYATGFYGETSNRFYNETFSFKAITNAPYIKVFLISESGKWTLLTGAFVNTDFEYRTQGNSTWINTSHIAFVPCDKYGNDIRDSAIIIETSISWRENPLQKAKFKKDFYEIRRGETLKVTWTSPEYEELELDVYYCLGIYKEEHGGSPLFYEDRIFRSYFVLDEEVTHELEPGEYYLRLYTVDQSDVYTTFVTMVDLIVD